MKTATILKILIVIIGLFSCSTIPKDAVAVTPFDKEKYLGKWYEIARFDFKFEKNLNNTTAEYSLNKNGTIRVENRGFNTKKKEWKQAIGTARFVESEDVAMLKVSFFGPFYSGYNVISIDTAYNYALVAGKNLDYLWILSRDKTIPDSVKASFLKTAEKVGYNTSELLWIEHSKNR